jgi:hypothetical protein
MAAALALLSKPIFEKLDGKPGQILAIDRYQSAHKTLDVLEKPGVLFLVTVRPDDELWLVAVLEVPERDDKSWRGVGGNKTPVTDLTPVKHLLECSTELQTPRVLSEHDVRILRFVQTKAKETAGRKKPQPYVVKLPKWLLEDTAENEAPAKAPKAVKAVKGGRTKVPAAILEGALAQIEESVDDLQAKPGPFLRAPTHTKSLRGAFTETVQGIFGGAVDASEARRLLREDLAPFVDGRALAVALLAAQGKQKTLQADDFLGELVDQFAIRAVDDVARALVALALGRAADVPATCASLATALAPHVAKVKKLL